MQFKNLKILMLLIISEINFQSLGKIVHEKYEISSARSQKWHRRSKKSCEGVNSCDNMARIDMFSFSTSVLGLPTGGGRIFPEEISEGLKRHYRPLKRWHTWRQTKHINLRQILKTVSPLSTFFDC
ncbi:MAG: hypothetical protein IPK55_10875 [Streptococcus sp.]|nr:hypothetical protein [Streptococcus sp.]